MCYHPTMGNAFRQKLLRWYRTHGRHLPWRQTHDPYRILIAEVMLQQTQVDRVVDRYHRWLKRFPTVQSLARASSAEVLKEWSGLGYNRRALAVQLIAKQVVSEHHGQFPQDVNVLMQFKGIGAYTAHAIAVFAYRQPVPLVDTNIKRVLGRIFLGYKQLERKRDEEDVFWELSRQVVARSKRSYDLNQGLMDFGALVCTAKQPRCPTCPMRTICKSYPAILTAHPERLRVKTKRSEPVFFGQPRRIWRGRILRYLHTSSSATLQTIGRAIQPDWKANRLPWLKSVVHTLEKDQMVVRRGATVHLTDIL
ncbi:MAG: A/G-specific adenine glycosylase [Candidatus Kerfeldbacteria bacterium]|nr:A/G-specific adenine glycosylase [Candidatus Kerfeldbacteria bacterium]